VTSERKSLTELLTGGLAYGGETLFRLPSRDISRPEFDAEIAGRIIDLRERGAGCGSRVVIHGSLAPPFVACLLACLLEGIVVIPIDAELPAPRKQMITDLSEPDLFVDFDPGNFNTVLTAATDYVVAEAAASDGGARLSNLALPKVDPDAGCYVFFTSGTTGTPKGILGRRAGLAHFLSWEAGILGLSPSDLVSILTRPSFDVVLRDLLLPVVAGAAGMFPSAEDRLTPSRTLRWIADAGVTVIHAVPSLAQMYVATAPDGFRGGDLRHTLFAGEPLSGALVKRWRALFPATAVHNLYGPTETTLAKFWARVPDCAPDDIQSCGKPLPDTSVSIVGEDGGEMQTGELGEVVIKTQFCSLGYLRQADGASRGFRPDKHAPAFRTGDLGLIDKQGDLHLRGRKDHQVKILGVRIEPVGVASLMQSHPKVRDAAVLALTRNDGSPQLVGYFQAFGDLGRISQELRVYLSERLPAAAVPSNIIGLDEFPVTPNGKLDRARLPAPPRRSSDGLALATEAEAAIAKAFAAALQLEAVAPNEDFFALGGDSLAAAEVCLTIERDLGAFLRPSAFLTAPTVRDLARLVEGARGAAPGNIPTSQRLPAFPLTPQQRRYFRTFCAGGSRSWCNMVAVFDQPAGTDIHTVRRALTEVVLRHNSLLLRFRQTPNGDVVQRVDAVPDFEIRSADLSREADPEAAVERLRIEEGKRLIPIFGEAPLFRATLLRLPGAARKLLWNVHHLVSDGTSQGILGRELLYHIANSAATASQPPYFGNIADWAWQHRGDIAAAREYHRRLLNPPYAHRYLPEAPDHPDPQRCLAYETAIPPDLRSEVRGAARRLQTTPFVVYLATYFQLAAALSGQDDVAVVTPLAGREHPQVAATIGDFINLAVLRVPKAGRLPAAALVGTVRGQVKEAAEHQGYQFDEVLADAGIPFNSDRNPLTGYSLNYMPSAEPGAAARPRHADRGYKLKYDILFLVRDYPNVTNLEVQYRHGLLGHADVERHTGQYLELLAEIARG